MCHLANTCSPVKSSRTNKMGTRSEHPKKMAHAILSRVRDNRHNPVDNPVDKVSLWITCGLFIAVHKYAHGTPRPAMPEHMFPEHLFAPKFLPKQYK